MSDYLLVLLPEIAREIVAKSGVIGIGDKLRLRTSCQEGKGDKSRGGLTLLGRRDLTIPKSRFSGAVK